MFQFGKPSLGGAVMGSLKRMMGGRPLPPAPPSMYHVPPCSLSIYC